jgi:hypothetical protein
VLLAVLLIAAQASAPAPQWRVASFGQRAIVYVDAASVERTGDEVRFRLQQRRPGEPTASDRAVHAVTADCATRSWRSTYSWTYRENGQNLRAEENLTTEARPGTVYGAALAAACEGNLGTPVTDVDRHAADHFAAPVTPR